ncbi:MAG TPA: hypothetical protein VMS96_08130 [Terriglobales bacterium]|nr:hypothetical protein [Terriglobales bacterium]
MKRIKTLVVVAVLAFAALAGWKVGTCELANMELQEDMLNLASGVGGSYAKYNSPHTDEDFREAVIRDAREHDIRLQPSQVTVRHTGSGSGQDSTLYLAADYRVPVDVLGYSFVMHFTPTSEKRLF